METFLSAEELRRGRVITKSLPDRGGPKHEGVSLAETKGRDIDQQQRVVADELEVALRERNEALGEPKVEKLGSLVQGEWMPETRVIKVTKNVGKHFQHMGSTLEGDRILYPVEALFLMDTKCMQVYYRGLPLSEMEAYVMFFSESGPSFSSLLGYQAYAHLSRLGYVVVRHQGKLDVTPYERKIGLDEYVERSRAVPQTTSAATDPCSSCGSSSPPPPAKKARTEEHKEEGKSFGHYLPATEERQRKKEEEGLPCLQMRHPEIAIPNVALSGHPSSVVKVHAPDPKLLPLGIVLGKERCTLDLGKLYSGGNTPYRRHHHHHHRDRRASSRDRDVESFADRLIKARHGSHHHVLIMPQRSCCSSVSTTSKNWVEYKEKRLQQRQQAAASGPSSSSPSVSTEMWPQPRTDESPCTPLLDVRHGASQSVLKKLKIIEQVRLSKASNNPPHPKGKLLDVAFDVYLPSSECKRKKRFLPPHNRLCVTRVTDPLPEIGDVLYTMRHFGDDISLHFAVVDGGDIAIYSFHDVLIPVFWPHDDSSTCDA